MLSQIIAKVSAGKLESESISNNLQLCEYYGLLPQNERGKFMVCENLTVKKTRYICVSVNGMEVYTENISVEGVMRDHIPAMKLRLREIQRVMPLGKWSIKIEQQWPEGSLRHYQSIDVVTGKLRESLL